MSLFRKYAVLWTGIVTMMFVLAGQGALAGQLLGRLKERSDMREQSNTFEDNEISSGGSLPSGVQVIRDVSYGSDKQQRFDVYLPARAYEAPVIFMVHGGAWFTGDKAARAVVENKVARWVPKGFIFVSMNYRLLPKADPLEQTRDVAMALAVAQGKAASWGGDRAKFILMGHSAGAHLVSLLAVSPSISAEAGVTPWLGTVSLDSAAFDVVQIMTTKHYRFYDRAFGSNSDYWKSASPFHRLTKTGQPFLAVCSILRDDSCPQASQFVKRASSLAMRASMLEQNLSHKNINLTLGEEGAYTEAVESFLRTLDKSIAITLSSHAGGPPLGKNN